jgi:hypothetical protein
VIPHSQSHQCTIHPQEITQIKMIRIDKKITLVESRYSLLSF